METYISKTSITLIIDLSNYHRRALSIKQHITTSKCL